jgi:D-alanyl-lipoteichoic acid acyltransferase DltB (MBOAT superfamily)
MIYIIIIIIIMSTTKTLIKTYFAFCMAVGFCRAQQQIHRKNIQNKIIILQKNNEKLSPETVKIFYYVGYTIGKMTQEPFMLPVHLYRNLKYK